jgi:hypothetical protein
MDSNASTRMSFGEWLADEIYSFAILAGYLFVCFSALLYMKFSILEAQGVSFAPWGFAAIKAVIVAKFMLIARRLDRHRGEEQLPLIVPTIYKSVAMLGILVALMVIEEVIAGWIHGRTIWQSLAEIGGGTLHQRIATIVVLLLILFPFFAFRSLGDRIGHRRLARMFFQRPGRGI